MAQLGAVNNPGSQPDRRFTSAARLAYELGQELGRGANGVVFLATRLHDGAKFAAKMTKEFHIREFVVGERLATTTCPHIVQLVDHAKLEDGRAISILDLCGGGELYDLVIDQGRLNEELVQSFFCQILKGLSTAHGLGVAHRDLKLENLLLSADLSCAKIADFGLATMKTVDQDHNTVLKRTMCGSRMYAAPELLSGEKYNPFTADIWSLGICLFAMLFSCLPFGAATTDDDNFVAFLAELKSGELTIIDKYAEDAGISAEARDVLKECLHPDPDQRIDLIRLNAHPWAQDELESNNGASAVSTLDVTPAPEGLRNLGWALEEAVKLRRAFEEFKEAVELSGIPNFVVSPYTIALGESQQIEVKLTTKGQKVRVDWNRNQESPMVMQEAYRKVRACFEQVRGGKQLQSSFVREAQSAGAITGSKRERAGLPEAQRVVHARTVPAQCHVQEVY